VTPSNQDLPDPQRDLVLERTIDVPRERVWAAWTTPVLIKQWFTPAPWRTVDCEIDLRPGGIFRTVMRSPEGLDYPHVGCYLEVIAPARLVFTGALGPGFRPAVPIADVPIFTAIITLDTEGARTKYTARVLHADEDSRARHEAMGFHDGWGAALDQLVGVAKKLQ
jgi:uncharacterized protein YndB with AHSA1/START domain